eukprot:scaffold16803_cov122-Isochrysis_galbana.AAC.1
MTRSTSAPGLRGQTHCPLVRPRPWRHRKGKWPPTRPAPAESRGSSLPEPLSRGAILTPRALGNAYNWIRPRARGSSRSVTAGVVPTLIRASAAPLIAAPPAGHASAAAQGCAAWRARRRTGMGKGVLPHTLKPRTWHVAVGSKADATGRQI